MKDKFYAAVGYMTGNPGWRKAFGDKGHRFELYETRHDADYYRRDNEIIVGVTVEVIPADSVDAS
jgi:hypothetical protein